MKTAISVPDETFSRVEQRASELGMSRSEFYAAAAQSYLDRLDAESVTRGVDAALALAGSDESGQAAAEAGRRLVAQGDDW